MAQKAIRSIFYGRVNDRRVELTEPVFSDDVPLIRVGNYWVQIVIDGKPTMAFSRDIYTDFSWDFTSDDYADY